MNFVQYNLIIHEPQGNREDPTATLLTSVSLSPSPHLYVDMKISPLVELRTIIQEFYDLLFTTVLCIAFAKKDRASLQN